MATLGQADLKTNYPVVEGLEADQKHDGQENNLLPEEKSQTIRKRVDIR